MAVVRIAATITGLGGAPGYTRFHYEVGEPEEGSTAMDFAESSARGFWAALAVQLRSGLTVQWDTEASVINPATGQTTGVVPIDIDPVTGAAGGNSLPWATQGLVRLRTGVYSGGREARGRCFIPGLAEELNGDGQPTSVGLGIMEGACDALLSEGLSGLVVISKGAAVPVVSAAPWSQWSVLRSRRD